jgi:hypothetical protein
MLHCTALRILLTAAAMRTAGPDVGAGKESGAVHDNCL